MARPRTYDEDEILSAAMHCFRAAGFRNASVKDLEKATGLTSGSLYNAYGDKEGLFRAALDHYADRVVLPRLAAFAGPTAGLDDLERLFTTLFDMPYADGAGCLAINSAVEFGTGPSIASDGVSRALDAVDAAFCEALSRHLPADRVDAAAARLSLLYQGLLFASRAGRAGGTARAAIRDAFEHLHLMSQASRGESQC